MSARRKILHKYPDVLVELSNGMGMVEWEGVMEYRIARWEIMRTGFKFQMGIGWEWE